MHSRTRAAREIEAGREAGSARERHKRGRKRHRERKKILSYFVAVAAPTCAVVFPMSYIAYWKIGASRLALEEKEEALLAHHAGLLLVVVVPPLLVRGSLLTPLLARYVKYVVATVVVSFVSVCVFVLCFLRTETALDFRCVLRVVTGMRGTSFVSFFSVCCYVALWRFFGRFVWFLG
jgi:hypothetical protein